MIPTTFRGSEKMVVDFCDYFWVSMTISTYIYVVSVNRSELGANNSRTGHDLIQKTELKPLQSRILTTNQILAFNCFKNTKCILERNLNLLQELF